MFNLHPKQVNSTVANATVSDHWLSVLKELTLEEKISLLTARDFSCTQDIPRLNIPSLKTSDSTSAAKGASLGNPLSTACFPNTAALAATWNRDLIFDMGIAVAGQVRFKGAQIILGPTVNIHRHPLGGRNFEAFSEDPVLTGQLAASLVNGVQSTGVAACLKHFVCNDSDTMRKKYSSEVDERTLREIYLAPFQWVIREANPAILMSAYNRVNGTYCCETPLYKQIVQKEWGYNGSWMSDWFGTESTAAAIEAGLDIEMPGPSKARGAKLLKLVEEGVVRQEVIDERVLGIFKMIQRTKEAHSTADEQTGLDPATNELIRKIAGESVVLLKNNNGALPIDVHQNPTIAVIGDPAVTYCGGGGSASGLPQYYKTPLDSIKKAHPDPSKVVYSSGLNLFRCIPMATPAILSNKDGKPGVDINYYSNPRESSPIRHETKPVPIVFMLGHIPEGLDEHSGFTYDITTTLTPRTTGSHTLAVLATGAFTLFVNGNEVLTASEPSMIVEDFLFIPHTLEKRCIVPMQANTPYSIRLATSSRRALMHDEPTPHSSKLSFLEETSSTTAISHATSLASQSDVSIVFAGRTSEWEGEGSDLSTLSLPNDQDELISAVAAASKKTIVVLLGGNPFDVTPWMEAVDAIVFAHFPGQEGGAAITDILTGTVNPSGKLPMTWPRSIADLPSNAHFPCTPSPTAGGHPIVRYAEGLRIGYRHFWSLSSDPRSDPHPTPLYNFGYGLSYTTFQASDLTLSTLTTTSSPPEILLIADISVTNTGTRPGFETVQVYIERLSTSTTTQDSSDTNNSTWHPTLQLKGFEKIFLHPNETKRVEVRMLRRYALGFWDTRIAKWKVDEDNFKVHCLGHVAEGAVPQGEGEEWLGL